MKPRFLITLLGTVLVLLAGSLADAQITAGRLDGAVRDAQGLALPGVTVTLSSPAMLGARVATTDVDGTYRFLSLPPGTYKIVYEMDGFATLTREGVVVETGRTYTVNVELQLATVAETITVTGESPVVDVKSSRFGGQFAEEAILEVPNSTDPHAMLALTPGIRMQGFDVAGSHKAQQSGFDAFGFRDNNRVVIDGVDSNFGTSGFGFYMDSLTVAEFNISNAGADVENAWAGNTLVMEMKSGGNDWSGLFYIDYLGEDMVGDNCSEGSDGRCTASGLEGRGASTNNMLKYWEGHADFGGPIVPDRAWWFVAYNNNKTERAITGIDPSEIAEEAILRNYYAKVNWQMSEIDQFVGYSQWGLKFRPNRGINSLNPPEVRLSQDSWTWIHKAEWQRVWNDRTFSNLKVMHYGVTWPMVPAVDPVERPPRQDTATTRNTGAGWIPFTYDKWRPQMVGVVNYYVPDRAGSHDFKLGLDWMVDSKRLGNNASSGTVRYLDNSQIGRSTVTPGGDTVFTDEIEFINAPLTPDTRSSNLALFAQDTWSPNERLTLNLGFRFRREEGYYLTSPINPQRSEFFTPGESPGDDVFAWNDFHPRLGVTYDLTGEGKTVLKASFSRYSYFVGADNVDFANPSSAQSIRFKFLDSNGNGIYDGAPGQAPPDGELGAIVNQSAGSGFPIAASGGGTPVELDDKSRYVDEFTFALEHELMTDTNLRVSFVRKDERNVFGFYQAGRVGALAAGLGIPCGDASFPCPTALDTGGIVSAGSVIPVFRLPAELSGSDRRVAFGPDGLDRNTWDNFEIGLSRRFRSGLFLQGSFHYQWRDELVCCGASSSADTQADPWSLGIGNASSNFHQTVDTQQQHTNWNAKLIGRYVLPYDIAAAWQFRAQSGWQYAPQQSIPIPGAGNNIVPLGDLDQRSDNVFVLDLRLEKGFSFWSRDRLSLFLDFFNLTNANPVLNFNIRAGSSYDQIFAFLEPRTLKIGARYRF